MRRSTRALLLPAILVALAAAGRAQTPFRTETTIVRVDVVVRDADGQPVEELDVQAFEVLEAGASQPIVWFERGSGGALVTSGAPTAGSAATAPHGWDAAGDAGPQSLVALVFHQLHPQQRVAATRAATAMVDRLPPGEFAAVYVIDQTMTQLAGFTRDREALRKAIRTVAMTPPAGRVGSSGGVAGEGGIAGTGGTQGDLAIAAMRARMGTDQPFTEFEAGAQGEAFRLLVETLDRFPGRRSVVLFSEGLAVPAVNPRLETVVDAAAPRHVSFYTIDANGLGTGGRRNKAPRRRLEDSELTSVSRETDWRPAKVAEMDTTGGLRPLAELTGGLYLSDSNDITAQLARVNADRRAFYVLGYRTNAPSSQAGTRPIEVRVTRPGLSVRARTRAGRNAPARYRPPSIADTRDGAKRRKRRRGRTSRTPTILSVAEAGPLRDQSGLITADHPASPCS